MREVRNLYEDLAGKFLVNMQGFSFISRLLKPESAATFRYNCGARDDDEKKYCEKIALSSLAENSLRHSLPVPEDGSRAVYRKVF